MPPARWGGGKMEEDTKKKIKYTEKGVGGKKFTSGVPKEGTPGRTGTGREKTKKKKYTRNSIDKGSKKVSQNDKRTQQRTQVYYKGKENGTPTPINISRKRQVEQRRSPKRTKGVNCRGIQGGNRGAPGDRKVNEQSRRAKGTIKRKRLGGLFYGFWSRVKNKTEGGKKGKNKKKKTQSEK